VPKKLDLSSIGNPKKNNILNYLKQVDGLQQDQQE